MNNQEYKELKDLFASAESYIKLIEQTDSETVIPAINELRYVGQHILESLFMDNDNKRNDHIQEAKDHASRAAYDALDAGILNYLLEFKQFKDDFRLVTISDTIPEWITDCCTVDDIIDYLSNIRNRREFNNLNELELHFKKLRDICKKLPHAREELTKKMSAIRRKFFYAVITLIVGVFSILATIFLR